MWYTAAERVNKEMGGELFKWLAWLVNARLQGQKAALYTQRMGLVYSGPLMSFSCSICHQLRQAQHLSTFCLAKEKKKKVNSPFCCVASLSLAFPSPSATASFFFVLFFSHKDTTETHKNNGTLLLRDHLFRSPTWDCGENIVLLPLSEYHSFKCGECHNKTATERLII